MAAWAPVEVGKTEQGWGSSRCILGVKLMWTEHEPGGSQVVQQEQEFQCSQPVNGNNVIYLAHHTQTSITPMCNPHKRDWEISHLVFGPEW